MDRANLVVQPQATGTAGGRVPLSTLSDDAPASVPSCAVHLDLRGAQDRLQKVALHGTFDTGRYRMPYFAWGNGPALVFIPGLSDDRLSFTLPVSRLADHFFCVAYDLPAGRDDGARLGRLRHDHLVEDLRGLLDGLGLRRTYLLGSSFGSTIALAAAKKYPERFERLILQGGFARRPLGPGEGLLASFARYWPWDARELPMREDTLRLAHFAPFQEQPDERWRFFLERWGAAPMAAVARRARLLQQLDLRPLLPKVLHPVMMICGEHDPLVGKECEAELLHGLPHVSRAEIEGGGHVPQFSHPEILAEIVERFLGVKDACHLPPNQK